MKRFLFALCVLGLLLTGWACAEISSYRFPNELCTASGIEYSISYSKEDQEWQATITGAPEDCTFAIVPSSVSCTAEWIEYKSGPDSSPEYWRSYNVPITAAVRTIGGSAFEGCTLLTSLTIPSSVKTISGSAFSGCPLTSIVVPNSVTYIGSNAFAGSVPVSVTLPFAGSSREGTGWYQSKYFGWIFSGYMSIPDTIRTVTITDQNVIGSAAFMNCNQITTINIPDGVTSIESSAFSGCTSLTDFALPSALVSIGGYAFNNCSSMKRLTLPSALVSIGDYAFNNCSSMKRLTLPSAVESIGYRAFAECPNAFEGEIDLSTVKGDLGGFAFVGCTGITGVTFGTELKTIGERAFLGCPLTEINVPDNVEFIGVCAFEASRPVNVTLPFTGESMTGVSRSFDWIFRGGLANVTLPDTIRTVTITKQTEIAYGAFEDCDKITTIHLPDGTTSIGSYAFENCTALTNFVLPSAVESIGSCAFNGCTALESVRYGGSPCMRELIQIDSSNEPLSAAAWTYALTKELLLPQGIQEIASEALAGTAAQVVLIPEGCAAVAADAFDNCPGLRYIVNLSELELQAPDGVTVLQR